MAIEFSKDVEQNSSARVKLLFKDLDGNKIIKADIVSATMVLRNKIDNTIIQRNGQDTRDVLDSFVDGQPDYNFAYIFDNVDNAVLSTNPKLTHEVHVATINVVINGATTLYYEVELYVKILRHGI